MRCEPSSHPAPVLLPPPPPSLPWEPTTTKTGRQALLETRSPAAGSRLTWLASVAGECRGWALLPPMAGGRLPWQGQGAKKKDGAQGEEDSRGILVISHFNRTSALACHVIEKENVSAKRASLNTFPNKNDKFVGVIPKMAF